MSKKIVTVLCLLVAFVPIAFLQFFPRDGKFDSGYAVNEVLGWPFPALSYWMPDKNSPREERYFKEIHRTNAMLNWAVVLLVGMATFLFLFHLNQRNRLLRLQLFDFFALTFSVGACLAVHRLEPVLNSWAIESMDLKAEAATVFDVPFAYKAVLYNYIFFGAFGLIQQIHLWIDGSRSEEDASALAAEPGAVREFDAFTDVAD